MRRLAGRPVIGQSGIAPIGLAEIPARDDDVSGIVTWRFRRKRERRVYGRPALGFVGAVAQGVKTWGHVLQAIGDDVNDGLLALQFAGAAEQSRTERGTAEALENGRPDD